MANSKFEAIDTFLLANASQFPKQANNPKRVDWNAVEKQYPEAWKLWSETWPGDRDRLLQNIYQRLNWLKKKKPAAPKSTIPDKDLLPSYHQNGHTPSDRIRWTPDEVKLIAEECVMLRAAQPFGASDSGLFEQAQRKVLPGERQRSIAGLSACPPLQQAIGIAWKALLEKPAPPPPPVEAKIVTLEVPRKLTAAEMLEALDEPAIEALLCAKRLQRESHFHECLIAIAKGNGVSEVPKAQPYIPRFEHFDAGEKKVRRIAIVGLNTQQADEVQGAVTAAGLQCALRFPGAKDDTAVMRCDYAIVNRLSGDRDTLANGDRAIGLLGRSHVVLADDLAPLALVQKVRDILSRAS